ncbi:uncharacterized protein LOC127724677 [Mytilus californianus]|uniref:uncharacterized protein LOC127724677 n=1 Tax=Mytilus californianus TaxID=6549 RepID=UPI002247C263|nr:uncharacterized protein LOC127724677 [Mytilus californianus]XP_052087686.1 uncharacterized protein LOC127724677 [Mytilus californianus]
MATNSAFCNICELRHLSNLSTHWCPECEQSLCSECREHHGVVKIIRNHQLIPIEDYQKLPTFISELRQSCQDHNENYQLYCPTHEICICYKCIKCHGKCGAVPLDDVLKDIKTSEMYKDLEQIITDMLENINEIKNDRQVNISDIETEKEKQLEEIRQMRLLVNNHLDKLEEKLKIEIEETVRKTTEKIRKTIVLVHETEQKISKNISDLIDIRSYASELQTFLGMKEMQNRITENEKSMQSLLDDGFLQQMVIKSAIDTNIGNYLSEIKVFGSVEILTKQERLYLRKRKNKQAQLLAVQKPKSIQDISLNRIQTMTSDGGAIRGCCVTPENNLLLTLHSKRKLSLMDFHGSCLASFPIEYGDAYDVTCLDNNNVAVTSGNSRCCGINIIHLPSKIRVEFINLPGQPYSIASNDKKMFCVVHNMGIYQIDKKDYKTSIFIKGELPYQSFVVTYRDKICYSNDKSSVMCTNFSGETLWEFNYKSVLQQPRGGAFDNFGNLYITGESSYNVVVLSSDGKQHREILSRSDGLQGPSAIFFDKDENRLIVSNGNTKILIFNVSQQN